MNKELSSTIFDDVVIGLISSYNHTSLCTVKILREDLNYNHFYSAKQYCDFRCSTNLERFVYDPFSGKKIDWKKIYPSLLIK